MGFLCLYCHQPGTKDHFTSRSQSEHRAAANGYDLYKTLFTLVSVNPSLRLFRDSSHNERCFSPSQCNVQVNNSAEASRSSCSRSRAGIWSWSVRESVHLILRSIINTVTCPPVSRQPGLNVGPLSISLSFNSGLVPHMRTIYQGGSL